MDDPLPSETPKRSLVGTLLRPKVALPLFALAVLFLSPMLIRGWNLTQIPDADEPTRTKPVKGSPTAESDTAIKQYRAAIEKFVGPAYRISSRDIERFRLTGGPPPTDPASLKRKRSSVPTLPLRWRDAGYEKIVSREQLIDTLDRNEEALREFRQATQLPFAPTPEFLEFLNDDASASLNSICALSVLHADRALEEERLEAAWDDLIAAYRFQRIATGYSQKFNENSSYFSAYSMIDCIDRLASSPLMTPELSRRVLADLDDAGKLFPDLDWCIDDSYTRTRKRILDLHQMHTVRRELAEAGSSAEVGSAVDTKSSMQLYMRGEPEISLRLLKQHFLWLRYWFDNGGRYAAIPTDMPYLHNPIAGVPAPPSELMSPQKLLVAISARDLYVSDVPLEIPDWSARLMCELTRHELIRIYVARSWFLRDHGRPAQSLEELVPDYLSELPADPFDPTGGPFQLDWHDWRNANFDANLLWAWTMNFDRLFYTYRPRSQGVF